MPTRCHERLLEALFHDRALERAGMISVGIIANPVSARDIRRVSTNAGNLSISDRANFVLRLLIGLSAGGVERVWIMPENGGIRHYLMRSLARINRLSGAGQPSRLPEVCYLDLPITGTAIDSSRAAAAMAAKGVSALVVLGGDGTHRMVVSADTGIPITGMSTGTNNAFPELCEPTVVGLSAGLFASARVPTEVALASNKQLVVQVNDRREIAIVDVMIVRERYVGARAVLSSDSLVELALCFGYPTAVGFSSIAGLLAPVSRADPHGFLARFGPGGEARRLRAPIAPGLVETVPIAHTAKLLPGETYRPEAEAGAVALDGERELVFGPQDTLSIELQTDAFKTLDTPEILAFAAREGLMVSPDAPGIPQPQ